MEDDYTAAEWVEYHHRTGNTLSTLSKLLELSADTATTAYGREFSAANFQFYSDVVKKIDRRFRLEEHRLPPSD